MTPLEENVDRAIATALGIFARIVDGKIGILTASRQLAVLHHEIVGDRLDNDWRVFVGIDSETHHLPIGEERKHWAPSALAEKDIEIKRMEDFWRVHAVEAARNLMRRYERAA